MSIDFFRALQGRFHQDFRILLSEVSNSGDDEHTLEKKTLIYFILTKKK